VGSIPTPGSLPGPRARPPAGLGGKERGPPERASFDGTDSVQLLGLNAARQSAGMLTPSWFH
jgi:hypothetical protein